MKKLLFILVLAVPSCGVGSTIGITYTFPMTIGLQMHFDAKASNPIQPTSQPAEAK